MADANPNAGAEPLTVESAAQKIVGIFDEPGDRKEDEPQETVEAESHEVEQEAEGKEVPEGKESAEEVSTEAEPESQELSFENLQQLAEAIEIPIEDLMARVKARVKVAGEEREVTLKELRDGYQMESDYRRKTSELSEQRKAFEAERERVASEINERFTQAQQMTSIMEDQLMGEYNSIDWTALRAQNPAEFAALKQEYNERYNQIQTIKANVANQLQAQQMEAEEKQTQGMQKMLAEEYDKLRSMVPELHDETKAKALKGQLREGMKSYGYSDQEIASVYDHRHILVLRDAMAYRAMQSKKPELTKKVVSIPKLQKPGAAKSKSDIKSERVNQKMAKLRKTGKTADLASLLLEKI